MSISRNIKKRALVTGASGYIGSNLVARLISDGWEVHIIVRPKSNLTVLKLSIESIICHVHDGTTRSIIEIVSNVNPSVVFHLASRFVAHHSSSDIESMVLSNILFSSQLVEAMAVNNIKYLINASTSWQHFENEKYNPVNFYAATKQSFEDILDYYVKINKIKAISLVIFDTYGPKDDRKKIIPILLNLITSTTVLDMSAGQQLIDIVYIDDVIDAFVKSASFVIEQKSSYERYAISSGNPIKLRHLVDTFQEVTNSSLKINWGNREYRKREVFTPWSSYKMMPGWMPLTSLRKGIGMVYEDFCANPNLTN
jgi:nucleoside-diphosphate-sugar epimerase